MSNNAILLDQLGAGTTTEPPAFAHWRDYPAGTSGYHSTTTRATSLGARLTSLSPVLFCDNINVRVIDIEDLGGEF